MPSIIPIPMSSSPRSSARVALLLAIAALAGCGSTTDPGSAFSMGIENTEPAAFIGRRTSTELQFRRAGASAGAVQLTLTGLPANVTAVFGRNPVPATDSVVALTFDASASAVAGTYPISVQARSSDNRTATLPLSLVVGATPASPSIGVTATTPDSIGRGADRVRTSVVTVSRSAGFAAPIALRILNLPPGWVAEVNAPTVPATVTRATVTILIPDTTRAGDYGFTVRASSGVDGVAEPTVNVLQRVTAR
ncbi:MAG: hypothetical protein MUF21_06380 [Gemmatimonadaceae bacterium]|jgi:uncharacterized membrane protein|nr:hypothetical protein [Gemmatimonadaceae bacterium]